MHTLKVEEALEEQASEADGKADSSLESQPVGAGAEAAVEKSTTEDAKNTASKPQQQSPPGPAKSAASTAAEEPSTAKAAPAPQETPISPSAHAVPANEQANGPSTPIPHWFGNRTENLGPNVGRSPLPQYPGPGYGFVDDKYSTWTTCGAHPSCPAFGVPGMEFLAATALAL